MSHLFDVSQETILITGASQGLGRQFARVLSAHGAAVVLAARQTAKLKSLEEEIKGKGGRAAAVQMDVTDTASIGKALDAAEAALGPVTVLINNAGIASRSWRSSRPRQIGTPSSTPISRAPISSQPRWRVG